MVNKNNTPCPHCGKVYEKRRSQTAHNLRCPQNPDKMPCIFSEYSWNRGKTKETDERVLKNSLNVSRALKGKPGHPHTKETRAIMSKLKKELYARFPDKHPNRRLANNRKYMSYPERVAYDFLKELAIPFEHQKKISRYFPDFVIGNTIIEIDGARFHDKDKDAERDKEMNMLGYTVYRIDTRENIQQRILQILRLV